MADINKYALQLQIQLDQEILRTAIDDVSEQFAQLEQQIESQINAAFMEVVGTVGVMSVELNKFKDITTNNLTMPLQFYNRLLLQSVAHSTAYADTLERAKGSTDNLVVSSTALVTHSTAYAKELAEATGRVGELIDGTKAIGDISNTYLATVEQTTKAVAGYTDNITNSVTASKEHFDVLKATNKVVANLTVPQSVNTALTMMRSQFGSLGEMSKLSNEQFAALSTNLDAEFMATSLEGIGEIWASLSVDQQKYFAQYAKLAAVQLNGIQKEGGSLNEHQKSLVKITDTIKTKNKNHETELDMVMKESGQFLLLNKLSEGFGTKLATAVKVGTQLYSVASSVVGELRKWDAPDDFIEANYRMIAGQYDLASAMETTAGAYGITSQAATEATKALISNGVATKGNFAETMKLVGTFGQLARVTGVSIQTQATLARNLKSVGMSLEDTSRIMGTTAVAMRTMGLSADDARNHIDALNSLIEESGVILGKEGVESANKLGLAFAKTAREIGIATKETSKLVRELSDVTSNLSLMANINETDSLTDKMRKAGNVIGPMVNGMGQLGEKIKAGTALSAYEGLALKQMADSVGMNVNQFKLLYIQSSKTGAELAKMEAEINDAAEQAKSAAKINDMYTESMENFSKQVEGIWNEIKTIVLPVVYTFMHALTAVLWVFRAITYTLAAIIGPFMSFASATNESAFGLEIFTGIATPLIDLFRMLGSGLSYLASMFNFFGDNLNKAWNELTWVEAAAKLVLSAFKMVAQVIMLVLGAVVIWLVVGGQLITFFNVLASTIGFSGGSIATTGATMLSRLATSFTSFVTNVSGSLSTFFTRVAQGIGTFLTSIANAMLSASRVLGRIATNLAPAVPVLLAIGVALILAAAGVYIFAMSLQMLAANAVTALVAVVVLGLFIWALVAIAAGATAALPVLLPLAAVLLAVAVVAAAVGLAVMMVGLGFQYAAQGVAILAEHLTAELAFNMLLAASAMYVLALSIAVLAIAAWYGAPGIFFLAFSLMIVAAAVLLAAYGMEWLGSGMVALGDGVANLASSFSAGLIGNLFMLGAAIAWLFWSATGLGWLSEAFLKLGTGMQMFADGVTALSAGALIQFATDIKQAAELLGPAMEALEPAIEAVKASVNGLIMAGIQLSIGASFLAYGALMIYVSAVALYNAGDMMYEGAIALQYNAILLSESAPLLLEAATILLMAAVPLLLASIGLLFAAYFLLIAAIILVPGSIILSYASVILLFASTVLYLSSLFMYPASEWLLISSALLIEAAIQILIGALILLHAAVVLAFAVTFLYYGAWSLLSLAAIFYVASVALIFPVLLFNLVAEGILVGSKNLGTAADLLNEAGKAFTGASAAFQAASLAMNQTVDPLVFVIRKLTNSGIVENLTAFAVSITDPITKIASAFGELADSINKYVTAMLELSRYDAEIGGAMARQQEQLTSLSDYASSTETLTSPVIGGNVMPDDVMAQPLASNRRATVTYGSQQRAAATGFNTTSYDKTDITPMVEKLEEVRLLLENMLPDLARRQRSQLGEWI
jgi:hypothetical protein